MTGWEDFHYKKLGRVADGFHLGLGVSAPTDRKFLCSPGQKQERMLCNGLAAIGHRPSAIGHRPSAIGHRPSAIGHPPSAIRHPPSAIRHPPSAIRHRPSAIVPRPRPLVVARRPPGRDSLLLSNFHFPTSDRPPASRMVLAAGHSWGLPNRGKPVILRVSSSRNRNHDCRATQSEGQSALGRHRPVLPAVVHCPAGGLWFSPVR